MNYHALDDAAILDLALEGDMDARDEQFRRQMARKASAAAKIPQKATAAPQAPRRLDRCPACGFDNFPCGGAIWFDEDGQHEGPCPMKGRYSLKYEADQMREDAGRQHRTDLADQMGR